MTVASMRRLSTSSTHKQGGNTFGAHLNQENQELPSLPPIREALSFYYDTPSSSSAKSLALSLTNNLSDSPLAPDESMTDVHDKSYTLLSEQDRERQRQQLLYANTAFDRAVDCDDRVSQVPRGYQSLAYPSLHDQNESPSGSYFDGNASTTSGISSPLSSSVFSSTTDSYAWSGPPVRRSAPQDTYSASTASTGWDRTGDTRRYTDSHYPPTGRPLLPPPPYRMDGHLPPYSSGSPPPYSSSDSYHQHPSRTQSRSMGSIGSFDRAAFPTSNSSAPANGWQYRGIRQEARDFNPAPYHHRAQEYYGSDEYRNRGIPGSHGGAAHSNASSGRLCDSNQRKRRGNLPKETTDKLRAWFTEHLHHPYPSEDEKQDLMHQTGLQMSEYHAFILILVSDIGQEPTC